VADTLSDRHVTTLGPTSFLLATDEECEQIAVLAAQLGREKMDGLTNWFLLRNGDGFHEASTLVAALRAGL